MSSDGYRRWVEHRRANPLPTGTVDHCGVSLSFRQNQIVQIIEEYICEFMCTPTYREIVTALGVASTNSLKTHFRLLKKKGVIDWNPRRARSIRLLKYDAVLIRKEFVDDVREFLASRGEDAMVGRSAVATET
jgi:SOS-response transcriptional repressor LexA